MIHCLIIDDEPIAHEILEEYVMRCGRIAIVGHCRNAMEAIAMLETYSVDLLFLDIQMPLVSGLTFLKNLEHPPQVIFTTAYQEYALDGFELNAVDYLLKPFSYERFLKAISKIKTTEENDPVRSYFFVDNNRSTEKIYHDDIRYIEAVGDYMKIYLEDRYILQRSTLKALEEQLPAGDFVRVHKSYIVPVKKIVAIKKDTVYLSKTQTVPVSQSYREQLIRRFKA
ncbi:response regulator transcription factor [Chitinophaga oryzae]|uniref:Response regulator transcription factor n=1 Tax=Chitinophaga oryzae TaxID=2725414 RepID=A0AAE6ZC96_9BACT|nr:LytTR family DNA-binding domain-containing protein [Chitinophaga oryzae]QJB30173.1 response regulator transcription factor [Chitinophaga oryzae]QJB36677.1 response regulator transcription factor [Chitinophaga oryzae]